MNTPHIPEPYRLERLLGQGGMGVVYLAYDKRLDRRVAVKRVAADDDDPRRQKRLRREARTAAQLTHPAVVQIFDLLEDDAGDWIVMELAAGTPLATMLSQGPLDVDRAIEYGRQIADGLAAAHDLGIVHRDLKTENVMILEGAGRAKILDFGLAKRLDLLQGPADDTFSKPGEVKGTGRAMSPEQARGLEVGPHSDLFSFGILLYESLTGLSPFRADALSETLQRVVTHQPAPVVELRGDVPRELSGLVDRLLNKAPELRPTSARIVADTLARLADERRFASQPEQASDVLGQAETMTETGTAVTQIPTIEAAAEKNFGVAPWWQTHRHGSLGALAVALGVAALAVSLAALLRPGSGRPIPVTPPVTAPDTTTRHNQADPLSHYEEGMRLVRRIDDPANVDRAIELFQRLLTRQENSAAAHAGLARAYWEKARNASGGGDPVFLEQAETVAREAVELDSYLADARVSLGLAELSRGRPNEARNQLDTALELGPSNADAHYGLAKLEESLGHLEEAEEHYHRAIRLQPTTLYLDTLGTLLYHGGRYAEAEEASLTSLELAPDNIHALRNLGGLYFAQGRLDEAADQFQTALKIRPNASLYSNLGTVFFSRGLYPRAATAFEDALRMNGASHLYIFWNNLADAYRQMPDRAEDARRSYHRAIELLGKEITTAPDDVRLLSRRALARARADEKAGANTDLDRIRELGANGDSYSLFRWAITEELCGEREQALTTLKSALEAGLALSEVSREPDLLKLRADSRFQDLL